MVGIPLIVHVCCVFVGHFRCSYCTYLSSCLSRPSHLMTNWWQWKTMQKWHMQKQTMRRGD